jgi:hypothetical protein
VVIAVKDVYFPFEESTVVRAQHFAKARLFFESANYSMWLIYWGELRFIVQSEFGASLLNAHLRL